MNTNVTRNIDLLIWRSNLNDTVIIFSSLVLIPIGIVLNFTQMMILLRKRFLMSIMAMYYQLISIYNILILIVTWFYFMSKSDLTKIDFITDIGCKLLSFFFRLAYQICSWLNVLVTLDRLIFIVFSTKFKFWRSKRNILILFFCSHLIFLAVNIPNFYFTSISRTTNISNQTFRTKVCTASFEMFILRSITSQIAGVYAPFAMMQKSQMGKDSNFALTLIGSNITFLVLMSPYSVFTAILSTYVNEDEIVLRPTLNAYLSLFETISRSLFRKEIIVIWYELRSVITGAPKISKILKLTNMLVRLSIRPINTSFI
ncbi:hypothetical protein BpHYR1_040832 [Brachionus plicatilis]|uniref:G-protein coupled receptors family 1 profile domain-containing protein n=1 Tax=Brachionus plicatilis TaxID=10195 RepID=A0A3M7RZS5_BRAPC|nr:hypothetical protein BpHYR1_040832 [Brachionus plicatilis]